MFNYSTHDHAATGRSAELDSLTGEAVVWLASLPSPVRVHDLISYAPDIANRLAASWNDVPSTTVLLDKLLADCSARSAPPAIARELVRLHEYQLRCCGNDAQDTTWELPVLELRTPHPNGGSRRSHS